MSGKKFIGSKWKLRIGRKIEYVGCLFNKHAENIAFI